TRELRVLGPNLVMLPDGSSREFLDEAGVRRRLAANQIRGVPLVYLTAMSGPHPIRVVGVDPDFETLHPSWKWSFAPAPGISADGIRARGITRGSGWMGMVLAKRLGVRIGDVVTLTFPRSGRSSSTRIEALVEGGGAEDESVFLPLG